MTWAARIKDVLTREALAVVADAGADASDKRGARNYLKGDGADYTRMNDDELCVLEALHEKATGRAPSVTRDELRAAASRIAGVATSAPTPIVAPSRPCARCADLSDDHLVELRAALDPDEDGEHRRNEPSG